MFKRKNINFDINATERPTKHVLSVLRKIYRQGYSNPSAAYLDAQKTAEDIERARQQVATALGCDADEIIFTSGASESNSLVQANFALDVDGRSHGSLARIPEYRGLARIKAIPMVVSETGEWLINEIKYLKDNQYFVDLTQAIGKVDINLHDTPNIIFASASGHKFGGILGCGILYINKNFRKTIKPLIYGTQEKGMRGGTYNVPAIICFGEAIEEVTKYREKHQEKIRQITNYIYIKIKSMGMRPVNGAPTFLYDIMGCGMPVNVRMAEPYCNVINLTFKNLSASTAVQIFDKYGINISAGSACHSGSEEPSEAYLASGYSREEALRTIRISVGCNNTMREAKKFIKVLKKVLDNYDI